MSLKNLSLKVLFIVVLSQISMQVSKANQFEKNNEYNYFASSHISINPSSNFSKRYLPSASIKLQQISVGILQNNKLIGTGFFIEKDKDLYTILTSRKILKAAKKNQPIQVATFDGEKYKSLEIDFIENLDVASLKIRTKKEYEIGKFKKLPKNTLNGLLFGKGFFNIGVKSISEENKPEYLLNSGNLIANSNEFINMGYQLIYSIRAEDYLVGGPIFDHQGFIVGVHAKYNNDKRLHVRNRYKGAKDFSGVSQGVPIDLILNEFQRKKVVKSKNQSENKNFILDNYDNEIIYLEEQQKANNNGKIITALGAINNGPVSECTSKKLNNLIDKEGFDSYEVDSNIRRCYGIISFTDKDIVDTISSDKSYEKSIHNKINTLFRRKIRKNDQTKIIKKTTSCEKRIVKSSSPSFLMESIQAEKDYDNCKKNQDKEYKAKLETNKTKIYNPGIKDKVLPQKIVQKCILMDEYRFSERYNLPSFNDCISYALSDVKVRWIQDPALGSLKEPVVEFWKNDDTKDNICKTFIYDDEKRSCFTLLNK